MKATRTDITAGEASRSAFDLVTTGLFVAWASSALPLFLTSFIWGDGPKLSLFNPLTLVGHQVLFAAQLWGIPFVGANLVTTWRLVFYEADRTMCAVVMVAASTSLGLIRGISDNFHWWWQTVGSSIAVGVLGLVGAAALVWWLLWSRRRQS